MPRLVLAALVCSLLLLSRNVQGAETSAPTLAGSKKPLPALVSGLKNPESVCIGTDGRIYVSVIGEFDKTGDGSIVVIKDGKATPFVTGLDDPKGIVAFGGNLYVADRTRIWIIDAKGKKKEFVPAKAFPRPPLFLNDMEVDAKGNLFVSDSGDLKGKKGAVYKIDPKGKVTSFLDDSKPFVKTPNGLRQISEYDILLLDFTSGEVHQVRLSDGKATKIADGILGGDGIARDHFGRVYLSSWKQGTVHVIPKPGAKPILLASGFKSAADLCLSQDGRSLLVPDMGAGTLTAIPAMVPGEPIDESPLAVTIEPAFADIEWTGWKGVTDAGKLVAQRPIVLTHAGGGDNRIFLATQRGVIHVFPNEPKVKATKVFLDMEARVRYLDNQNEEGFLGLAFHPAFRKNGEFFVYYTPKKEKDVNYVSRFRASKEDPNRADLASEEVLLKLKKPFWNHDGGTISFGPDGYLYIAVGDGGKANDPFGHGQNLNSLLGKILRIDINSKSAGLPYGIPADNPFVKKKGARGEIWAYGFRNIWRMSFDTATGQLWAADVGQNLWEEINIVVRGGNYGWNPREALHAFENRSFGPVKGMIDPIWEYHHDIGKSITGGMVYRGTKVPALKGMYLYADYVSGTIWALKYDEKQKRVTANRVLRQGGFPVYSFGEDSKGEVYLLTSTPNGKGIFRFAPAK